MFLERTLATLHHFVDQKPPPELKSDHKFKFKIGNSTTIILVQLRPKLLDFLAELVNSRNFDLVLATDLPVKIGKQILKKCLAPLSGLADSSHPEAMGPFASVYYGGSILQQEPIEEVMKEKSPAQVKLAKIRIKGQAPVFNPEFLETIPSLKQAVIITSRHRQLHFKYATNMLPIRTLEAGSEDDLPKLQLYMQNSLAVCNDVQQRIREDFFDPYIIENDLQKITEAQVR